MKQLSTLKVTALSLLAVMAISCDQELIETQENTSELISFNTVVGKQTTTRAKEFGYWQGGQTLNVKAYETNLENPVYQNFNLTYNGPYTTSWTYSPLIEVPNFSLTYYAYHPQTANISNMTANGKGAGFSYTVPETNEDLIAATTITSSARVALMFYHLLTEVNFAVQAIPGIHVDISNIKINNVANSSSYTFSPSGGSWSTRTGDVNYPYTPIDPTVFPTDGSNGDIIYLGNKGGNVATDNDNSNALMLMPQTFASGQGGNITFDYSLTDMNNNVLRSGSTKVYLGDFTTNEWKPAKRYLYLLDLTGLIEEGPITYEVIVFGWSDIIQNVAQPIVVAYPSQALLEKAITTHNTDKATTPSLTVFPISLPIGFVLGINETITLKDFSWSNFQTGDQIRIQCDRESNASNILLDDSIRDISWSREVEGSVVTLIKL